VVNSLLKRLFGVEKPPSEPAQIHLDEDEVLASANAAIGRQDFLVAADTLTPLSSAGSTNPDLYVSYAYALLNLGQFAQAKTALQAAIALAPKNADAHYMLGKACAELGEPEEAELAWTACYEISQTIEALYCDFCLLLFSRGKIEQAVSLMTAGVKRYPLNADIHFFLGNLQAERANFEEAVAAYQQSLALGSSSEHLLSNYGNALRQTGDLALAIEMAKRALQIAPGCASIFSNYLLGIQYSPLFTKEQKFAAHLDYAKSFETPVLAHWGHYKNDISRKRKLRIGYVSGDFRNHSLIFFIVPILANHDKSKFEVYGYYACPLPDADTLRVKNLCDEWIACHDLSDDALEARIRADEIDILIDLSGHTGHNRLLTFARKPAPVQMTWLGYQATTGLSAIDFRITEEALDPIGESEAFHSEKLLRLPSSGTFSPSPESPQVNPLPALTSSTFTFACLNNPSKISDDAIALWSEILHRSPSARLLIGHATPALIKTLTDQFASHNIPPNRIAFQPKLGMKEYLQLHHEIDLALDTFPYNGGTTTFHSLWMGVPVLALEGDTALSKVGATIMSGLGLPQFCCLTRQSYVDQAVYFASRQPELAAVRLSLREQMAVLTDCLATEVTLYIESAFENCWSEFVQASLKTAQGENDKPQASNQRMTNP
jgi:protein O-GlcNAc transferase